MSWAGERFNPTRENPRFLRALIFSLHSSGGPQMVNRSITASGMCAAASSRSKRPQASVSAAAGLVADPVMVTRTRCRGSKIVRNERSALHGEQLHGDAEH